MVKTRRSVALERDECAATEAEKTVPEPSPDKKEKPRKQMADATISSDSLQYFPQHFLEDLAAVKPNKKLRLGFVQKKEDKTKRKMPKNNKEPYVPISADGSTKFGAIVTRDLSSIDNCLADLKTRTIYREQNRRIPMSKHNAMALKVEATTKFRRRK